MELIANLMIAANGVTARFLDTRNFPSLRRVVKSPERWDRIRDLAEQHGYTLPPAADPRALADFLERRKADDPGTFPDVSMTVIKLLGRGEYVVDPPGVEPPGHFGLAVRDYSHSTAPNRRFPDLVTQRLVKATLAGHPSPYSLGELEGDRDAVHEAGRCGEQSRAPGAEVSGGDGDAVEGRSDLRLRSSPGASDKGTFVRTTSLPIEGKLLGAHPGLDVGDRLRVRLSGVDIDRGFIDFRTA